MNWELYYQVKNNEDSLTNLLCKYEKIKRHYIRYFDDKLKDMYDHNYFIPLTNIDDDFINLITSVKQEHGYGHLKVIGEEREQTLIDNGFEENILLTMVNEKLNVKIENKQVTFKNIQEDDIAQDIIDIEIKHYGEDCGADFCKRKLKRYFKACKENKNLNFYAAYIDNKIVAYCDTYFDQGVIGLDGLVTDINYRHQKIATSLFAYIYNKYKCPIYLHASDDDTPKEMYKNMGFKTIFETYEYLKIDNKKA